MTINDIIPPVKDYILTHFLRGEEPGLLTSDTALISGGVLDSLAVLELVAFLEERFGIRIEAHEADRDRMDTLNAIARLVEGKLGR